MRRCVIGIDTSNYTTSVAILDENLHLVASIKHPLPVKEGERGLRQSDALFAHTKNLPIAFAEVGKILDEEGLSVSAIGVSSRPRNQEGSYMPCFLAGVSAASSAASTTGVPLFQWSHQCGHIMAALYGSGGMELLGGSFGAFHVSGGTTELVKAHLTEAGFEAQVVGGSKDLHAGQAIDRIGVAMGLQFPAGPALEALAKEFTGKIPGKKPAVDGCYIHLSGLENMALQLYRKTQDKQQVAAFVFDYIGNSLQCMASSFIELYGEMPLVFGGGVMSNTIIKQRMQGQFHAYIADPVYSADNAIGIAVLTARKYFN